MCQHRSTGWPCTAVRSLLQRTFWAAQIVEPCWHERQINLHVLYLYDYARNSLHAISGPTVGRLNKVDFSELARRAMQSARRMVTWSNLVDQAFACN